MSTQKNDLQSVWNTGHPAVVISHGAIGKGKGFNTAMSGRAGGGMSFDMAAPRKEPGNASGLLAGLLSRI